MKLHFLGANRQVTGSRYLLEAGGLRVMIDCGLFQERKHLDRNWAPSPIEPGDVSHLLLTHAHLDHCGLIPKFVNEGYRNPILATHPSMDLATIVLEDAAEIQEEDAKYKRKRHEREGRRGPHPEVPLYTREDADAALKLFQPVQYDKPVNLNERVQVIYRDAGHILGSSFLQIIARENGESHRVIFSGDIGQSDHALMHDPHPPADADWVIMESTYGDREHEAAPDLEAELAEIVNDTVNRGGNVVIPTFAIDRAQELMYFFSRLVRADRIPDITVFLDSPMAVDATDIYKRYKHLLDEETRAMLESGRHPFQFPGMHYVRTASESRSINTIRGSCIIMAGSGMCTGGRIKHHLRQNIGRPESTILFVGFQSEGTLGRQIIDGKRQVRIHGKLHDVRARIARIYGLSAHADRTGLTNWIGKLQKPPRRVFLTHGEESAALALAEHLRGRFGYDVDVPQYQSVVTLNG